MYQPQEEQPVELRVSHRNSNLKKLLKVASVLLIVGVGLWVVQEPTPSVSTLSWDNRVQQHVAEKPALGRQTRLSTETDVNNLALFQQAYEHNNYAEGIALLEKIADKNENVLHYLGLCYFKQQTYGQAITYFKQAIDKGKGEQALWYLFLAQYEAGNKAAAKQALQDFINLNQEWRYEEAKLLLKEMELEKR